MGGGGGGGSVDFVGAAYRMRGRESGKAVIYIKCTRSSHFSTLSMLYFD